MKLAAEIWRILFHMGDEMTADETVRYEEKSDSAWVGIVDGWKWHRRGENQVVKVDLCPRCNHRMSVLDDTDAHVVMYRTYPGGGPPPPQRKHAICNCTVEHEGAPEGKTGCGAHGLIDRA